MHGGTCSFAGGTELFWIMKSKQKGSALGKPHRPVLVTGRLAGELPGCRWVEFSGRIVGLSWDRVLLVCFSGGAWGAWRSYGENRIALSYSVRQEDKECHFQKRDLGKTQ